MVNVGNEVKVDSRSGRVCSSLIHSGGLDERRRKATARFGCENEKESGVWVDKPEVLSEKFGGARLEHARVSTRISAAGESRYPGAHDRNTTSSRIVFQENYGLSVFVKCDETKTGSEGSTSVSQEFSRQTSPSKSRK